MGQREEGIKERAYNVAKNIAVNIGVPLQNEPDKSHKYEVAIVMQNDYPEEKLQSMLELLVNNGCEVVRTKHEVKNRNKLKAHPINHDSFNN